MDIVNLLSELPRHYWMILLTTAFIVYYLREVVKRPILVCSKGPFKKFLRKNVPLLQQKYWPTLWCFESRAQTVFASIIRSSILSDIDYRREILTLSDGGEVALDWLERGCSEDSPVIIILPGLTGESQAEYIKCLVTAANQIGIRCVVFNNRGLGGIILKTPRLYCAANVEDVSEVVQHVHRHNPHVKIGATGISMGGLLVGNYLATKKNEAESILTAAMIISVPWNVFKGTISIEKPYLNSMLGRHLASNLCRTVGQYEALKTGPWDMTKVLASKTIKEFDSNFTSKHFGYKDVEDYYTAASLHTKLDNINVPLMCLSAADDPFQPLDAIPVNEAEDSSHVAIVITARGGHIGFMEGIWPMVQDQYMSRLFVQYFSAVFAENSEINNIVRLDQTASSSSSAETTPRRRVV